MRGNPKPKRNEQRGERGKGEKGRGRSDTSSTRTSVINEYLIITRDGAIAEIWAKAVFQNTDYKIIINKMPFITDIYKALVKRLKHFIHIGVVQMQHQTMVWHCVNIPSICTLTYSMYGWSKLKRFTHKL